MQITWKDSAPAATPPRACPPAAAKNFTLTPLTIGPDSAFGKLSYKTNSNAETGTRLVVLKGEAKVGDETIVQYSPAFPITVSEK